MAQVYTVEKGGVATREASSSYCEAAPYFDRKKKSGWGIEACSRRSGGRSPLLVFRFIETGELLAVILI